MSTVEFTPQALRSAKFREKLKGYHPEDVDAFLERAATAMDQLSERLSDATARAMKAEGALAGNSEADENVRRTLVRAQRTAEMAVREANEDARRARVQAQGEADAIVATARDEACRLRADAEDAAARLDEQAERVSAMAREQATMTISSADAAAAETVRTAEERSARLGHESSTRIEAERAEAHAEHAEAQAGLRRWCDEAAQRADAAVRSAERQHEQLRADVATLAGYLANERARVLDVLTEATEHFSHSLTLRPPPLSDELVGRPTALPVASRPENATPLGYETDSDETAGGETAGGETGSGVLVGTAQVTADQREPVVDMIGHEQPMDHQSGKDHQSDEDHPPVGDDTVADHQLIEHRVGADQLLDQPTDGRPDDQWADDQWVEEASEDMAAPCDVSACSDPVGARSVLPAAVAQSQPMASRTTREAMRARSRLSTTAVRSMTFQSWLRSLRTPGGRPHHHHRHRPSGPRRPASPRATSRPRRWPSSTGMSHRPRCCWRSTTMPASPRRCPRGPSPTAGIASPC